MSMNRIDGSQLQPLPQPDSSQGTQRSDQAGQNPGVAPEQTAPEKEARAGDTLEISDKARQLMELRQIYDAGLEAVAREPEMRSDKVEQAKQRLESGFYHSVEVRQKIADGVLGTIEGTEKA